MLNPILTILAPLIIVANYYTQVETLQASSYKQIESQSTDLLLASKSISKSNTKEFEKLTASDTIEDKIVDTISKLPEVIQRQKYVEKQTKSKRHLSIWVESKPNSSTNYYLIKVVEENGCVMATHFNFHVYPSSMKIKYLDTQNDKEISLEEWRKRRSHSNSK